MDTVNLVNSLGILLALVQLVSWVQNLRYMGNRSMHNGNRRRFISEVVPQCTRMQRLPTKAIILFQNTSSTRSSKFAV
jgi:hypothetical protein